MGARYRVAADIGGTFTDIVRQDSVTGECSAFKVLSTPEKPRACRPRRYRHCDSR